MIEDDRNRPNSLNVTKKDQKHPERNSEQKRLQVIKFGQTQSATTKIDRP